MTDVSRAVAIAISVGFVGFIVFMAKQERASTSTARASADKALQDAYVGAKVLRERMRNPATFDLIRVVASTDDRTCYVYRAENGFGGMSVESAVLIYDDLVTEDRSEFDHAWGQYCATPGGRNITRETAIALKYYP